jgi:hypothetical protein
LLGQLNKSVTLLLLDQYYLRRLCLVEDRMQSAARVPGLVLHSVIANLGISELSHSSREAFAKVVDKASESLNIYISLLQ